MRQCAMASLADYGVFPRKKDFEPFIGSGEDLFIGGVAELHGVPYDIKMKERAYEIYVENAKEGVKLFPGIPELFSHLHKEGFSLAIASSADEIKVRTNIKAAGIPEETLSAVVSGSQVERKKPFPDIFVETAKEMELPPDCCLVVEDAVNGIQAAAAADMQSIGVASFFPADVLYDAGARYVVEQTKDMLAWVLENKG